MLASRVETLVAPTDWAWERALERMEGERSQAVTWPWGMWCAREAVMVPEPAPTSTRKGGEVSEGVFLASWGNAA